jgi:ring-1,2-phenylacetyl-CoA epoxidase subunit PaaC
VSIITDNRDALFAYLIRLGDNALIAGQQLGKLVGHGPELEEEMATANFALDFVGQARMFYSLAGEAEGKGRSEDDIAFLRDGMDFHNLLLLEQPNGDFAQTIARQFLFESFYQFQLAALSESSEPRIAEIAVRVSREIEYHLRHTRQWLVRLGDGTDESHARMQRSIDDLWRFTGEMFSADEIDDWAAEQGIGPDPASLHEEWTNYVDLALRDATLQKPDQDWMASGGKQGTHTEHLGYILAEMQHLPRSYPGASW